MPPKSDDPSWVIVHSTHPSKGSAALPGEIAELLGVTREAIARGGKEARRIASPVVGACGHLELARAGALVRRYRANTSRNSNRSW